MKEEDYGPTMSAPPGSSLNGLFVKEGEDFPYCGFQEPWIDSKGQRVQGLEIFFEEGILLKATEGKIQSTEEEDVIEMVQELFVEDPIETIRPRTEAHVMALTEEGQLVDPVCLIRPAKSKGGLSVKGSDYVRVNNVGRISDYKLLGDFLKNVPFQLFINEIYVIS